MNRQDELEKRIEDLLDKPEEWTLRQHTLDHVSGLQLWTSNEERWFRVYKPEEVEFSSEEVRGRLWKKAVDVFGYWKDIAVERCLKVLDPSEPPEIMSDPDHAAETAEGPLPPQWFTRTDKQDGSEEIVSRAAVENVVRSHFNNFNDVMTEVDAGHRIASPFAYYDAISDPQHSAALEEAKQEIPA